MWTFKRIIRSLLGIKSIFPTYLSLSYVIFYSLIERSSSLRVNNLFNHYSNIRLCKYQKQTYIAQSKLELYPQNNLNSLCSNHDPLQKYHNRCIINVSKKISYPFSSSQLTVTNSNTQNINENSNDNNFLPDISDDGENLKNEWEAGDIENDLNNLRMAVLSSESQDKLNESKRYFLLDAIAKGRRAIIPDLVRYIFTPIIFALYVGSILSSSCLHDGIGSNNIFLAKSLQQRFFITFCTCMDIHFWSFTITGNLLLLPIIFQLKPKKIVNQIQQKLLSQKKKKSLFLYGSNLTKNIHNRESVGWMNPSKEPYTDPARIVLEMWTSSIVSVILFYFVTLSNPKTRASTLLGICPQYLPLSKYGNISLDAPILYAIIQLCTRLAVAMSIHQYPRAKFELIRSDQPKPLPKSTAVMQPILKTIMIGLPFGFACDLAKVFGILQLSLIRRKSITADVGYSLLQSSMPSSIAMTTKCCGILPSWFYIFSIISLVCPILHFFAFQRIFQIQYFTNLSLAESYPISKNKLESSESRTKILKWRWRLKWRKQERLSKTLKKWYQLLVAGYASREDRRSDKLYATLADWREAAFSPDRESIMSKSLDYNKNMMNPNEGNLNNESQWENVILRLEEKRYNSNIASLSSNDRSTWVSNAMKAMAERHQQDYDDKIFDDYLGVALHQTLGIGLSFNYDHETELKPKESPSIHRLRARAAKSAIARARELYNPILAKEILNSITDEDKQMEVKESLRQQAENEIEYFRSSLKDLLSSGADPPDGNEDLEMQLMLESDISGKINSLGSDMVAKVGEAPDLQEEMLRNEFGNDYVNDPWVQQAIRNQEISAEDIEKMKLAARNQSSKENATEDDEGGDMYFV